MASRSTAELKRELESERERLGDAAQTLRRESRGVARNVAVAAAAAVTILVAARVVGRRVFRRG
jgi:hypothetical protein